ncbi:MAG: Gfo/Idh/MocA family oxidoreductase [Spirochaetaceae bacterium]|jgi:predicted dehydrogenase|nr:Gfo/Idh/MocA family oxidoreductase [Spirochaetaceae bacterium]
MISVLIIGAGGIANSHIAAYGALGERVRITAVADTDKTKAEALIQKHTLSAKAYGDYREALSEQAFQIASICTPAGNHCAIVLDCFEAGLHVLLEKPMAPSLAECDAMISAAEKKKRLLSVVAQNRYTTGVWNLKRLLEEGHCGKLLYVQACSVWWRGQGYYDTPWRGSWEQAGGGCTLNLAIHYLDLLLWMAGKPKELTAFMANVYHPAAQVEDLSSAYIRFAGGAVGELTCSQIHHGDSRERRLLFETERAELGIPFSVYCSKDKGGGFPEEDAETAAEIEARYKSYPPLSWEGHIGQIADFVQAVETSSPLLLTGRTGRDAVEVVTGIYKSAVTKQPVSFPIAETDLFYSRDGILQRMPRY